MNHISGVRASEEPDFEIQKQRLTTMVTTPRLSIRDLALEDLDMWVDYWFRAPPGFAASLGLDFAKFPPEPEYRALFERIVRAASLQQPPKGRWLTVLWDQEAIGLHLVSDIIEGETAQFHSHYWKASARGKGLGRFTFLLAGKRFMDRFDLQELQHHMPKMNPSPNRVMEKLGFKPVNEPILQGPLALPNITCNEYRVTRAELDAIIARTQFP